MSVLIKGMDMPKNCSYCQCGRIDSAIKDPLNTEIINMYCLVAHTYWACYRHLSGRLQYGRGDEGWT